MKTKTLSLFVLALCSYLSADTYCGPAAPAMEPQTELERLTVIMAKYSNNTNGLTAIDYAILHEDEPALDLLIKYGASVGHASLECARKTGSIELFHKIVSLGARLDYREGGYLFAAAIQSHQNDIATYLIKHGAEIGCDVLKKTDWRYLEKAKHCGNMEIHNLLVSYAYIQDTNPD